MFWHGASCRIQTFTSVRVRNPTTGNNHKIVRTANARIRSSLPGHPRHSQLDGVAYGGLVLCPKRFPDLAHPLLFDLLAVADDEVSPLFGDDADSSSRTYFEISVSDPQDGPSIDPLGWLGVSSSPERAEVSGHKDQPTRAPELQIPTPLPDRALEEAVRPSESNPRLARRRCILVVHVLVATAMRSPNYCSPVAPFISSRLVDWA